MKSKAFVIAILSSIGLLVALTGCAHQSASTPDQTASAADQESSTSMVATNIKGGMNWYGGPVYRGEPALKATAALVRAGGGAQNFTFTQALVSMLGQEAVNAEVAKLTEQYGKKDVQTFINGMTGAVNAALQIATKQGITLPQAPADLKGATLAKTLVKAGTAKDGTFWAGHLFDVALSHDIHNAVMGKIESSMANGHHVDKTTHKILNQAMYDVAQALGMTNVKLAPFH